MKLRLLLSLSLLPALATAFAETADNYFHGGAVNYLSNNIPMALEVVTNGRALFADDVKLKKLEELLKQQSQQQQKQQEQQQSQKDQQQKQDNQQSQAQKEQQDKKENQSASQQPDEKSSGETNRTENAAHAAGQMTPQQARQLLDAQKAEEAMIPIKPEEKPIPANRRFKDW